MTTTPDDTAAGVTEGILHSLLRTWGLLKQAQEPYFARFGISPSQWGILRVLQRAEDAGEKGVPLTEVGNRLLIQPPSVTGAVDRLERQGLVKRSHSKTDLRVRHLSLTPEGRRMVAKVLVGHRNRVNTLFAGLQSDEQHTFLALLKGVETHLGKVVSEQPGTKTVKDE